MKKTILTTAILSLLLVGCNDNKIKTPDAAVDTDMIHDTSTSLHEEAHMGMTLDNSWINEIELDNGTKWEANEETNIGVKKMLTLIKEKDPQTVEDYHDMASELNEHKNYVVKECTMQGPSHDNLHVFLHPLIDKIAALGEVTTTQEGAELNESIRGNLEAYYTYFK